MSQRGLCLLDETDTRERVGVAVGVVRGGGAASLDSAAKPGRIPIRSITLVGFLNRHPQYNLFIRGGRVDLEVQCGVRCRDVGRRARAIAE